MKHQPVKRISYFRFYEELNDFLPAHNRKISFPYSFTGTPSIKNTIEAIGVPHTEVDLIIIEGESVSFDYLIQGGERISVYPAFETFDISPIIKLRPKPLRIPRFVVDVNLGKLAQKLRLLGFDTLFRNDLKDHEIVELANHENRIILTRDKGVLMYSDVSHGYWVRNHQPKEQLKEVISRLQLQNNFRPFSRCSNCNSVLKPEKRENVKARVPDETFNVFEKFFKCEGCGQIYWEGSHFEKILGWVEELK